MTTTNPNDDLNATQIRGDIKRRRGAARAVLEAAAMQHLAQKYDLTPRQAPLSAWVFFDERSKPIAVSEDKPTARPFRRNGKWVRLGE